MTCPLCAAETLTARHHSGPICWSADCKTCGTPMVVWAEHGTKPPAVHRALMLAVLERVAVSRYGAAGFVIDERRRSIPSHWHAHARPRRF